MTNIKELKHILDNSGLRAILSIFCRKHFATKDICICILPYKHNNLMYCAKNVKNKTKT